MSIISESIGGTGGHVEPQMSMANLFPFLISYEIMNG